MSRADERRRDPAGQPQEADPPVTFSPRLRSADPLANYWLRQVSARLRREIAWLWYERGAGADEARPGALPPFSDRAQAALDLTRFAAEKQHFFATDVTAQYLTQQLEAAPPAVKDPARGSFSWVVAQLGLSALEAFLLGLGAGAALDHSLGSVIAACHNHPNQTQPTLALAQKLWDDPAALLAASDPAQPLFRYGLLQGSAEEIGWDTPLHMPPLVANALLFAEARAPGELPPALTPLPPDPSVQLAGTPRLVADRLAAQPLDGLRIVPVRGQRGSARRELVAGIAAQSGRPVVTLGAAELLLDQPRYLQALSSLCWLRGVDLFMDEDLLTALSAAWESSYGGQPGRLPARALPAAALPLVLYLGIVDRAQLPQVAQRHWLPLVDVPVFSYAGRVAFWQAGLGERAKGLEAEIAEVARRFRFGKDTLRGVLRGLQAAPGKLDGAALTAACRAEVDLDIGELAQRVRPRFAGEELLLPPLEAAQFAEVAQAMHALTEVHYVWGTADAWNESGISALFAGASGTGKTMAAELLARQLDLPMYRIDLSQVVNKYIGETEKNLKRLFDAAEHSDLILFFDEADALFGKRTDVKDAHDRYANIEINYLLERMERFKGMAILATNRKKDLDEAFMRRLRYIVDFPQPGPAQREQIWRQVTPKGVDASALDYPFLAAQFRLTGGSIRSAMFNACLQSAGRPDGQRRLSMETVLLAVKREYDKLNHTLSLETFGPYAEWIRRYDRQEESQ